MPGNHLVVSLPDNHQQVHMLTANMNRLAKGLPTDIFVNIGLAIKLKVYDIN
jgi:hypothetical protein